MLNTRTTAALYILLGVALELGIGALSGRREAWDSEEYWTLGLPIAGLVAMGIGFFAARHTWLWALAVAPGQALTMIVRNGEIGLWPLTMIFAAIIGAPFVLAAFVGSRLRRVTRSAAPPA